MTKKDLKIIRGQTYSFNIVTDDELTNAYLSVKKTTKKDDEDYLVQKTLNNGITLVDTYEEEGKTKYNYAVRIAPEDTNDLDTGKYYYDCELIVIDDVIPLLQGRFQIDYDITRKEF